MSDSQSPIRYVLGPISDPVRIDAPPPDVGDPGAGAAVDRTPRFGQVGKDGVTLIFPGDPGVSYLDPVECRAYFVPSGADVPTTAEGFLGSAFPFAFHSGPVPQGPESTLVLSVPEGLTRGNYLVQSVFGFPNG